VFGVVICRERESACALTGEKGGDRACSLSSYKYSVNPVMNPDPLYSGSARVPSQLCKCSFMGCGAER
jgi:hypothetical protein